MNWTEITQALSSDVWYITELKYFPDEQSTLFLGAGITSFKDRIIFNSPEIDVSLWAVAADHSVSSAVLKDRRNKVEMVCAPQTSTGLTTQFPGIAHADRSSFVFSLQPDDRYSDHIFDVFVELAGVSVHFASLNIIKKRIAQVSTDQLHMAHQIEYLHNNLRNKKNSLLLAQLCAHLISIGQEKTRAAIYAVLGDALVYEKRYQDAINAFRKALEIQPQNVRVESRIVELLKKHHPEDTDNNIAIPKGIALSTSGDSALTVIVDMLHTGTPSYMFVRELFQNELDAIYRRWDKEVSESGMSDFSGLIRIGPDAKDARKLCFWGNGIGMTFDQVTEHLAKLVNTGNDMHHATNPTSSYAPNNLGIGAKTSALPDNTEGMVYRTLSYGETDGIEFSLWKNPNTFLYEIKAQKNGQKIEHCQKINSSSFITDIQQLGSGTSVTLLGKNSEEKTIDKLQSLLSRQMGSEIITKSIAYFLNSRYFTLPAVGLDVQVADIDDQGLLSWIPIIGQKACLERHSIESGTVTMKAVGLDVFAHWWILSETAQNSGSTFNALGHVGLLWKNELYYNPNESQRVQRLQLNCFGIHQGEERVVIYIEPSEPDLVDSHSSRAQLMFNMRELNASDFGERFSNKMPVELLAFQKSLSKNNFSNDKIESIKNNLLDLGVHKNAKMRELTAKLVGRGKSKKQQVRHQQLLEKNVNNNFNPRIPGNIWREFDEETILFAAEWDSKGYLIKFNTAWPHYQKTLATLVDEARVDYAQHKPGQIRRTCESLLRFEYLKTAIELIFSSYSLLEYSSWNDRMIENQLLSPAALSAILQYNSSMRSNIKLGLANGLRDA